MTPRKAKDLLQHYFGTEAVNAFDPLWPETIVGAAPGSDTQQVLTILRRRLAALAAHQDAHTDDAHLLARVMRSVAAQMIDGPGAEWTHQLEAKLNALPADLSRPGPITHIPAEPTLSDQQRRFRALARAIVATRGTSPQTIISLHAVADESGLPPAEVQSFLDELVGPASDPSVSSGVSQRGDPRLRPAAGPRRTASSPAKTSPPRRAAWLVAGGAATLLTLMVCGLLIIRFTSPTLPSSTTVPQAAPPPITPQPLVSPPVTPRPVRPQPPLASGPPDGRIFARSLNDALNPTVDKARQRETVLQGIITLRRWWPQIDTGSRIASVQALRAGAVEVARNPQGAAELIATLKALPTEPFSAEAVWYHAGAAGIAAGLAVEPELSPVVVAEARRQLAAATPVRRQAVTFDEAALAALTALPSRLLAPDDQASTTSRAIADAWFAAVRAASGELIGSPAPRSQLLSLDAIERLLTSGPQAAERKPIFEFCSTLLAQVDLREGDPARDRILAWFPDQRWSNAALHLVTTAISTRSAAAGIEPTMVLPAAATQADRDDLAARYAQAWSRNPAAGGGAGAVGPNRDWFDAARAALQNAAQATDELQQLEAAVRIARLNQAAALRSRGLPVTVAPAPSPAGGSSTFTVQLNRDGDGLWATRYLAESRTTAARLARIAEFEQMADPGPVDCEVLADVAFTASGEIRAAAQRAANKRTDSPAMINAVLEHLPRVPRSARNGEFLGTFTLAGSLPPSSEQWGIHFRRALIQRLLVVLAAANATAAADRAAAELAECWGVIAGDPPASISEADGPTASVDAANRAWQSLIAQVQRTVPEPTAIIHPAVLQRAHAGRLAVAVGLPQAFAASQVSAVEALAVLVAAERPATSDSCRSIAAELALDRQSARSIAQQIRLTEAAALRLWALRLGEPL